jgi:two-component system phosphate regulon sensor histidine kinase PhoR
LPLPDLPDFEGLLDGLSEGVLALSPTRAILFANAALAPLLNRPPRDCRGIPLWEALRHRDIGALADAVLREGQEISREVVVAAPEERVFHVRARPRVPSGAVLVFNDLTSLRRLERLRQEFVANVSHELKTPLTALRAALETLLDGAMDDPAHARDFLETAEQEVHRLQRLIDDLLDLSRWERPGAAPRLPTSTPFDEVARNTFAALRPLAAKKNVTLEAR